jgi:hypothetical protein
LRRRARLHRRSGSYTPDRENRRAGPSRASQQAEPLASDQSGVAAWRCITVMIFARLPLRSGRPSSRFRRTCPARCLRIDPKFCQRRMYPLGAPS